MNNIELSCTPLEHNNIVKHLLEKNFIYVLLQNIYLLPSVSLKYCPRFYSQLDPLKSLLIYMVNIFAYQSSL